MREFDFDELDRAVHSVLGTTTQPVGDDDTSSSDEMVSLFDTQQKKEETDTKTQSAAEVAEDKSEEKAEKKAEEKSEDTGQPTERISSHAIHSRVLPAARQSVRERPALRRHQPMGLERDTQETSAPTEAVDSSSKSTSTQPSLAPTGPQPKPRPLARRRAGRFMDVVHPSSDMRVAPSSANGSSFKSAPFKATSQTSRPKGMDIAPVAPPAPSKPEYKAEEPAAVSTQESVEPTVELVFDSSPVSTPVSTPKAPEPVVPVSTLFREAVTPRYQPRRERDEMKARTDNLATPSSPVVEAVAAQESPFVVDAQVEKRPLGGIAKSPEVAERTDTQLPPDQSRANDEMQEKIRQIESMDFSAELKNDAYLATPTPEAAKPELFAPSTDEPAMKPDVPVRDSPTSLQTTQPEQSEKVSEPESKPTTATAMVSGPTSITRQYKAEPRVASVDDTSPIFDPESYHQPLEHEPKHKSGWGLVIGIVVLIVVSGAVAAFLWWSGVLAVPL